MADPFAVRGELAAGDPSGRAAAGAVMGVFSRDGVYPNRLGLWQDASWSQVAAVHEIGHLLGLRHVLDNVDLPGVPEGDHPNRYGVSTQDSPVPRAWEERGRRDLMGMGSRSHLWHARPWQRAMLQYQGQPAGVWQAHFRR